MPWSARSRSNTEVTGVQVLVLVDDKELVVEALEVVVGLERPAEEGGQLGEQGIAVDAAVLLPGGEESMAGLLVDLGIGVRLQ